MIDQMRSEKFRKDGYIVVKNFFDKDEISSLRRDVKKIFALQIRRIVNVDVDIDDEANFEKFMYKFFELDVDTFMNCGKEVQQLISLHKIGTDSRVHKILVELGLEFPIISVRPSMLFNSRHLAKKEEYWKLGAHQDWRSSQGSLDAITLWFPLVKSDKAIGALQVIPKSHILGLLDSESVSYYGKIIEEFKEEDYLQLEFEIGDILLFSSFLVHRSGVNITESIRWSVQLRYNNIQESTFIERGFPNPFIYKPQPDLMTPGFPDKKQLLELFRSKLE